MTTPVTPLPALKPIAMLLNEFLKAHRRMEEQDPTIARQQKQIESLTTGFEKVSAQLEVDKSVPQIDSKHSIMKERTD